jgi:hypothetical protein
MPAKWLQRLVQRRTRPWNDRCVALQQRGAGDVEEGVSTPHRNTPTNATGKDSVPRHSAAVARDDHRDGDVPRRATFADFGQTRPVRTRPIPKTVWSRGKRAGLPEHVADVERLEHAEHRPEGVHGRHRQGQRRPPGAGPTARAAPPRRGGVLSCTRGTGSMRIRATNAPTRKVAASARNAPRGPTSS